MERTNQESPGQELESLGSPAKALSKTAGYFLKSCGPYTKNVVLDPSPFKRQENERKENLLGHLLSSLSVACKQPLIQWKSVKSLVAVPSEVNCAHVPR